MIFSNQVLISGILCSCANFQFCSHPQNLESTGALGLAVVQAGVLPVCFGLGGQVVNRISNRIFHAKSRALRENDCRRSVGPKHCCFAGWATVSGHLDSVVAPLATSFCSVLQGWLALVLGKEVSIFPKMTTSKS